MSFITITALCYGLLLCSGTAFAEPKWNGSGGWGTAGRFGRMYDTKTVESLRGEVVAIEEAEPLNGMGQGIHLSVKTDKETIPVHLGPSWFLLNQDVQIRQGDKVEITGSRVKLNDKPVIIAARVAKGSDVLTLRNDQGFPVWSGWRHGNQQELHNPSEPKTR